MSRATESRTEPRKIAPGNATNRAAEAAPSDRNEDPIEQNAAFTVHQLNAWYGDKQAIQDVTFDIPAKSITAIIGPSGCGKSTVLRCLNRMHELVPGARMEGDIRLFGKDLYAPKMDPAIVRRRVGMVFQKSNPFPTMSIEGNVTAGLRLNGIRDSKTLKEKTERALTMSALWDEVKDRLNRPGGSLSGGQQQRLCIARAIAVEPEVLLMDEPASALDPIATSKIEELMHGLKDSYTIVIVTHNMQQASRVSDRTAFFYLGKLIEYEKTGRLFSNPQKTETQDYVQGRFG